MVASRAPQIKPSRSWLTKTHPLKRNVVVEVLGVFLTAAAVLPPPRQRRRAFAPVAAATARARAGELDVAATRRRHRDRQAIASSRRRFRSNIFDAVLRPCTCVSAGGPRCRPSGPSSNIRRRSRPSARTARRRCHSVRSCFSPLFVLPSLGCRDIQVGDGVAAGGVRASRGSRPRLPSRITLLTEAMSVLHRRYDTDAAVANVAALPHRAGAPRSMTSGNPATMNENAKRNILTGSPLAL